jgi:hypothetical protein
MQLRKAAADLPQNLINWIERWILEPINARVYAVVRITYGVMALGIVLELCPSPEPSSGAAERFAVKGGGGSAA